MIVRHLRGLGAEPQPGQTWEQWCDIQFANNPEHRNKCKTKPWGCCPFGVCPPWAAPYEAYGAGCRGIPVREELQGDGRATAASQIGTAMTTISIIDKIIVPRQEAAYAEAEKQQAIVSKIAAETKASREKQQADSKARREEQMKLLKKAGVGVGIFAGVALLAVAAKKALRRKP